MERSELLKRLRGFVDALETISKDSTHIKEQIEVIMEDLEEIE